MEFKCHIIVTNTANELNINIIDLIFQQEYAVYFPQCCDSRCPVTLDPTGF